MKNRAGTEFTPAFKVRQLEVKKVWAFILAVFYISSIIGATVHQHYCMGELVGTSLFDLKDDECGKCGMIKHPPASKDCCKHISIVFKTSDSHIFSQMVYDFSWNYTQGA